METVKRITVKEESLGERLDSFLAKQFPDLSRSRIKALLLDGHIKSRKGPLKPSSRLIAGDELIVALPQPAESHMKPEAIELEVLFEDADLVVINKPAGLIVHPGAGHADGTLANALLFRYPDMQVGDVQRPGIVHRLDKETSGVMVCARHNASFASLVKQFKSREVKKIYRAFCYGTVKKAQFELITGHARHKSDRKRFTTKLKSPTESNAGVRLAHSRFKLLRDAEKISELEVELLTGRTHQIRAHLADLQHPLLHDPLYGGSSNRFNQLPKGSVRDAVGQLRRHALHAEQLTFAHPSTEKLLTFRADLPEDLLAIHDAISINRIQS